MRFIGNRAALISAYLVALVYVCWPVLEHPTTLSNPIWQFVVIAFFVASIFALAVDRLGMFTMIIAALNGLAGLGALVSIVWAIHGKVLGSDERFYLPAVVYFAIAVPLITAVTLFVEARTRRHGGQS